MSNMKKILAMAITFVMVLGIMAPAFALPQDVVGTEYEDAAAFLGALNIMVGDAESGNFRPTETIKRSEFAKVAVLALGLESAADAAKGSTQFPDVVQNHWAEGYINVAVGQGVMKGDVEGTFRPDEELSYGEALTVLVRSLGYKDNFLSGAWPANFIAKAAEVGITKGISVKGSSSATRGNVAKMLVNTLDSKVIKVDTYEGSVIKYYESKLTLLEDKLEISKYEDVRIVANKRLNDGLEEDEVTVFFTKDIKDKENNRVIYSVGTRDFYIIDDLNVENVLGEEATIYVNDDDEIIYAESENDDRAKIDYVATIKEGSDDAITKIELAAFDETYALADNAYVYVMDGSKYTNAADDNKIEATINDVLGHTGKFVVRNNKIVYAEIWKGEETYPWMLVTKNNDGLIEGYNETDKNFDIDLTEDGSFDAVKVFDINGNEMKVEDIEEGNILYVQKQDYDGDDYAFVRVVKNNKLEGSLEKVKDDRMTLDGKTIKVVQYKDVEGTKVYDAFYSINNGEDIRRWGDSSYWSNDMEDADDEDMVAYTDAVGRIAYLTAEVKATSGYRYGVVTKIFNESEKLKIYTTLDNGDGDEITYSIDDAKYVGREISAGALNEYGQYVGDAYQALTVGDVVKFKLNRHGEIAEKELFVATETWNLEASKDFGKESISSTLVSDATTGKVFSVNSNTSIIDAKDAGAGQDTDDFGIVKWADMREKDYHSDYEFYVFADDKNAIDIKGVVFIGTKGADSEDDDQAIYVIDRWYKGGDDFIKYIAYNGDIKEVEVDSGLSAKERPYIAKEKSDGTFKLITVNTDDFKYVSGTVYDKDGDIVTIAIDGDDTDLAKYRLSGSKTVVYEEDDKKSTSNIRKGDAVYMLVEQGVNVRVVERLVGGEADDVKAGNQPY